MITLVILQSWREPHGHPFMSTFAVPHVVSPPLRACPGRNQHYDDLTVIPFRCRFSHKCWGHHCAIRRVAPDPTGPRLSQRIVFFAIVPRTLSIRVRRSGIKCELELLVQLIEEQLRRSPILILGRVEELRNATASVRPWPSPFAPLSLAAALLASETDRPPLRPSSAYR